MSIIAIIQMAYDLVKVETTVIIYQANKRLLPNNLQLLFNKGSDKTREARQSKNLRQVFSRTTLKARCLSICGIKLWNSLDRNIQCGKIVFIFF